MAIYVKITDKYLYIYENNKVIKKKNLYIKNGRVDDVDKFIIYLKNNLDNNLIKRKYIFILDNLLNNSDIFVYNYVFKYIGLLNYKIIRDIDIIKNIIDENNIIISNWSSSITYTYFNGKELLTYPLNIKIINTLNKKYIIAIGDQELSKRIKLPIYKMEEKDKVIFNCL